MLRTGFHSIKMADWMKKRLIKIWGEESIQVQLESCKKYQLVHNKRPFEMYWMTIAIILCMLCMLREKRENIIALLLLCL